MKFEILNLVKNIKMVVCMVVLRSQCRPRYYATTLILVEPILEQKLYHLDDKTLFSTLLVCEIFQIAKPFS